MLCFCVAFIDCGDTGSHRGRRVADTISTARRPEPRTFLFECDDSYTFVARSEGDRMWLFLPDTTIALPHVPAASGARYSDGTTTFWSRGEEARLETASGETRTCRNNHARAIWEHAKLNGVDFRAVGNEPGWHLEISSGLQSILLVTDYGATRFEFPYTEPMSGDGSGETVYRTKTDDHELTILLVGGGCHDTMSGEEFETGVTIHIDGRELRGCGRALH